MIKKFKNFLLEYDKYDTETIIQYMPSARMFDEKIIVDIDDFINRGNVFAGNKFKYDGIKFLSNIKDKLINEFNAYNLLITDIKMRNMADSEPEFYAHTLYFNIKEKKEILLQDPGLYSELRRIFFDYGANEFDLYNGYYRVFFRYKSQLTH